MKHIPFFQWIKTYSKADFGGDLSAGLTVGVMLIPQGMAYAMLAGLPPIYGLYASTIPLILYAIFGTSRQLAVGPVAMISLLIASGVGALAELESSSFIALAIMLSLMVGVIQLAMGVFRLGFLVNFLSHPVIAGFTSAAALIIGFSQLKHLLGLDIPRGKVHEVIISVFEQIDLINMPTLIIGVVSIGIILTLRKINKKLPTPLIIVVLSLIVVGQFHLEEHGVSILKDVPSGFPTVQMPVLDFENFTALLPIALTISLVGFMESIAVAKAIQSKHKNYEVIPNQELIGLGLANIGGAFFQAFPTTGGFSRTAVNDQSGAKTGMASIISALVVILTLLFFTPYFYYLPKAVLAAIIMVAVFGLIDIKEAKYLWKTDKRDFMLFMITALATLFVGIEEGIIVGVLASLGVLIYQVSYPHMAELGKLPNTDRYRNVSRFERLENDENILIVRLDAPMFFANISYFETQLKELVNRKEDLELIILHAGGIDSMDSSALHLLHDLVDTYRNQGVDFYLTDVKGPVRDILSKSGMVDYIGKENFFVSVNEAVHYHKEGITQTVKNFVLQTNI